MLPCPKGFFCPSGTFAPYECSALASCPESSISQLYYGPVIACVFIDLFLAIILYYKYRVETIRRKRVSVIVVKEGNKESNKVDAEVERSDATSIAVNVDANDIPNDSLLIQAFGKGLGHQKLFMRYDFKDLGFKVKGGPTVLHGVSGQIRPGKLTAIMGPSGAGKTTFLNVLMGKVKRTSGQLFLNGFECDISAYQKVIGFVPQEDIMLRECTVYENILHNCQIRLPKSWSDREINDHARTIIKALDLEHVQHTQIGDEATRGISGGQRKRVNIGMELSAIPLSLYLDEPTSGLDSTAALSVCRILKRITSLGVTCVCILHQPRSEIFFQLDDLLLIAPGGRYFLSISNPQDCISRSSKTSPSILHLPRPRIPVLFKPSGRHYGHPHSRRNPSRQMGAETHGYPNARIR